MGNSEIQKLKRTLGMGARSNKYRIMIPKLSEFGISNEMPDILVKNTTMPGKSFTDVQVWVQGRQLTVAGDAVYEGSWNCTFHDTEDHILRNAFKDWMTYIDSFENHDRDAIDAKSYMTTIRIDQLSAIDNRRTTTCELQNAYVKSISEISFADDASTLIEFSAEFNYSHWI